jgi:hypothetical protein
MTSSSSSVAPKDILVTLHQMMLDPVNFERKVLSTAGEQTKHSSGQLNRPSSHRRGGAFSPLKSSATKLKLNCSKSMCLCI